MASTPSPTSSAASPAARLARRLIHGVARGLNRNTQPQGTVTLDRRHLYILPSRSGAGFAVLLFVMLLTSLNYNVSLGFALTFMLGGIGMACMWQAYRNLLDLTVSGAGALPVFAGEDAAFTLRLGNAARRLRIGIRADLPGKGGEQAKARITAGTASAMLSLASDAPGDTLTLHLPATRRGVLPLPRVTLSSRFPLGLFHVWGYANLQSSTLVYPSPEAVPPPLPSAAQADDTGHSGRPSDTGIDTLRRYRDGDPPHRIAWKHSARADRLLSRTGEAGTAPACWLDWQAMPATLGGELRLSRLCAWVLAAGQDAEIGLRLPGVVIPPGRGAAHRRACLEALALWRPVGSAP